MPEHEPFSTVPQQPALAEPMPAPRQPGVPLTFFVPGGAEVRVREGVTELRVRVRLTSYRSLPLSCIREIRLAVDGAEIRAGRITFVLDGHRYRLDELGGRTDLWWYVLDEAELLVALDVPMQTGMHTLDGSLTTLVPFATGGRTTMTEDDCIRVEMGKW